MHGQNGFLLHESKKTHLKNFKHVNFAGAFHDVLGRGNEWNSFRGPPGMYWDHLFGLRKAGTVFLNFTTLTIFLQNL